MTLNITDSVLRDLDNGKIVTKIENGNLVMSEEVYTNYTPLFMFYHHNQNGWYRLFADSHDTVLSYVKFDNSMGVYVSNYPASLRKGNNNTFPYKWINRNYSSKYSLDLFPQPDLKTRNINYPFTVGIEYESCAGFIPEYYCIHKGLIPLKDGSISGTEYASTVIKPSVLLDTIDSHTGLLKTFCDIDNNCSTHIHLGNIPLNVKDAFCIYACLHSVQKDLFNTYLTPDILHSSYFKSSGKDYCKELPKFENIEELYAWLSMDDNSEKAVYSFYDPHPASRDGRSKWNIITRYYWCNFINYFFYPTSKTIEFRFLPPTASPTLIKGMVFLMGEIIRMGIRISKKNRGKAYTYENIEGLLPKTIEDVLKPLLKAKREAFKPFLTEVKKVYSDKIPVSNGKDISAILLNPNEYRYHKFPEVEHTYYAK